MNSYDDLIGYNFIEISRKLNVMMTQQLTEINLTFPQYRILSRLYIEEGITHKQLSEYLSLKSQTLTPILNLLEKKGWIYREVDKEDARNKRVFLTEHGTNKRNEAFNIVLAFEHKYFEVLGDDNNETLLEWIKTINKNLEY